MSADADAKTVALLVLELDGVEHGAIPEQLAAEAIGELLAGYLSAASEEIRSRGGTLAGFDSTRVTAFWKGDAEGVTEACRCALALQKEVSSFPLPTFDTLRLHAGIAVGKAIIVSTNASGQPLPVVHGSLVRLAETLARRQLTHGPGILVSQSVMELAGEHFGFEPLEPIPVREVPDPVIAYRLLQ